MSALARGQWRIHRFAWSGQPGYQFRWWCRASGVKNVVNGRNRPWLLLPVAMATMSEDSLRIRRPVTYALHGREYLIPRKAFYKVRWLGRFAFGSAAVLALAAWWYRDAAGIYALLGLGVVMLTLGPLRALSRVVQQHEEGGEPASADEPRHWLLAFDGLHLVFVVFMAAFVVRTLS
jgi:hypothetical protein